MKMILGLVLALLIAAAPATAAPLSIGQAVKVMSGNGAIVACPNRTGPGSGEDYYKLLYPDPEGPIRLLDFDSKPAREYRDKYGCRLIFSAAATGIIRAMGPLAPLNLDSVCVVLTITVGPDGYLNPATPTASATCYWIERSDLKACNKLAPPIQSLNSPPNPPGTRLYLLCT